MTSYLIDSQHIRQYLELQEALKHAAMELFRAYIKALPDKQDWTGFWSWGHPDIGLYYSIRPPNIEINISPVDIEYRAEFYSSGETTYKYLSLPHSALSDPLYLERAKAIWKEEKAVLEDQEKRREETQIDEDNKRERIIYENLKRKYEQEERCR